jgi:AcrR family transcriptional regulator
LVPRPDVSKERKKQILEASLSVFSRLGFDKARMDDIVEASGLSKGTLYWYFKSKDEIIIALLDQLFEGEFNQMESLQSMDGSAEDKLMSFLHIAVADIKQMLSLLPVTFEFYALAFRNKAVQQCLKDYFRKYMKRIVPTIQQGIDNGEFIPSDPVDITIALGAIIEGTVLLWLYDPETVDLERHVESSLNLLLHGIKNTKSGSNVSDTPSSSI